MPAVKRLDAKPGVRRPEQIGTDNCMENVPAMSRTGLGNATPVSESDFEHAQLPNPPKNWESLPDDPYQQALWVAKAIKNLSGGKTEFVEEHADLANGRRNPISQIPDSKASPQANRHRKLETSRSVQNSNDKPSMGLSKSRTNGVGHEYTNAKPEPQNSTPENKGSKRQSFRQMQQRLRLQQQVTERRDKEQPSESPCSVSSPDLCRTLFMSLDVNKSPANIANRNACGTLLFNSLFSATRPSNDISAAVLKSALADKKDKSPFVAALRILASNAEIMDAADKIIKDYPMSAGKDSDVSGPSPGLDTPGSSTITDTSGPTNRAKTDMENAGAIKAQERKLGSTANTLSEKDRRTNEVIDAVNCATAILTELSAREFHAHHSGVTTYVTPYGNPSPQTFVSPYADTADPHQKFYSNTPGAPQSPANVTGQPESSKQNKEPHTNDRKTLRANDEAHSKNPEILASGHGTGNDAAEAIEMAEPAQMDVDFGSSVRGAKGLAKEKFVSEASAGDISTSPTTEAVPLEVVDNFLQFAKGDGVIGVDSSDSGHDSDATESVMSDPSAIASTSPIPRPMDDQDDKGIQAIVNRIITDIMVYKDNLRCLPPGTSQHAFYGSLDGQQLAAQLKRCLIVMAPKVNTIIPAAQSQATSTFYSHLSSRAYQRFGNRNNHPAQSHVYGYPAHTSSGTFGVPPAFQPPPPPQQQQFVPRGNVIAPPTWGVDPEEQKKVNAYGYPPLPGSRPGQTQTQKQKRKR